MDKKVFVAVPTYTGQVDVCATSALVANIRTLEHNGYQCELYFEIGCCYIAQARNRIVQEFLESDCEDLIMLDSDLWCQKDTFLHLVNNTHQVVFAAYKYKHGPYDGWPIRLYTHPDYTPKVTSDGFLLCEVGPTGIMRVNRSVYELMIVNREHWKTQSVSTKGNPIYAIYDTGMGRNDGNWYGEDYMFCLRCRDIGIPVHCYPDILTEHAGGRNNRIGNYHEFLKSLPKPEINDDDSNSIPEMVSNAGT